MVPLYFSLLSMHLAKYPDLSLGELFVKSGTNFLKAFKILLLLFLYMFVIPVLPLIGALLLWPTSPKVALIILRIWVRVIAIYLIYLSIKVTFVFPIALDKNQRNAESFFESFKITKGRWWITAWNLFLIGLVIRIFSFVMIFILSLVGGIISLALPSLNQTISILIESFAS